MRSVILIILLAFTALNAQMVSEEVATQNVNQVFYHFDNGEVKSVSNTNWHIAFKSGLLGGTVRSNQGVQVLTVPELGFWDFPAELTEEEVLTYTEVSNSTSEWRLGAFNVGGDPQYSFDYGWGEYSQGNGIFANKFFILAINNGASNIYKQFAIEKMQASTYYLKWADLDGSNLDSMTVPKSAFSNTDFGYVNILTKEMYNDRPAQMEWDLVFQKYRAGIAVGPDTYYYPVTGVLSGEFTWVVQENEVSDIENVEKPNDNQFSPIIDVIGYDWKTLNSSMTDYNIAQDTVYFAQRFYVEGETVVPAGDVYKIIFTDYEDGTFYFDIEKLTTGIVENNNDVLGSFSISNNMINEGENINILYSMSSGNDALLEIYDMNGQKFFSKDLRNVSELTTMTIPSNGLSTGMYFVTLTINGSISTEKLLIK